MIGFSQFIRRQRHDPPLAQIPGAVGAGLVQVACHGNHHRQQRSRGNSGKILRAERAVELLEALRILGQTSMIWWVSLPPCHALPSLDSWSRGRDSASGPTCNSRAVWAPWVVAWILTIRDENSARIQLAELQARLNTQPPTSPIRDYRTHMPGKVSSVDSTSRSWSSR